VWGVPKYFLSSLLPPEAAGERECRGFPLLNAPAYRHPLWVPIGRRAKRGSRGLRPPFGVWGVPKYFLSSLLPPEAAGERECRGLLSA